MKILIIKTSSLGDIIQTFPVLEYLRKRFPIAKIDWVVEHQFAELVEAHPAVNDVYHFHSKSWRKKLFNRTHIREMMAFNKNLRREAYDVAFDFQGNTKSSLVTWQVKSTWKVGFNWRTVSEWPNLLVTNLKYSPPPEVNVRDENLYLVKSFLNDMRTYPSEGVLLKIAPEQRLFIDQALQFFPDGHKAKVMVCPGSAWPNKQMSHDGLRNFLLQVQTQMQCAFYFIWGNQEEYQFVKNLENAIPYSTVLDKMPLAVLQNLMARMNLVVAMDSLPLHLAGTTDTPTFSIFGSSLAEKYKPAGSNHYSYQGKCPFKQDFDRRCTVLRTCPSGACIRSLNGNEVYQAFQRWSLEDKSSFMS